MLNPTLKLLGVSLTFIFLACPSFAYTPEEGNVSAVLGPFFSKTNFNGSSTGATAPQQGGIALMALGDVSDHGSLEIAMMYLNKLYFREQGGKWIGEKTQLMHVTMGYRRWITPYFSTSLSLYSAYSMGEPQIVHNDFVTPIETSVHDNVEYGFDLAFQGELWSEDRISIVADARYSRSVTPKDNSEYGDHYGLLIGVRYFIQDKKRTIKPG